MINTPRVSSNGISHYLASYDITCFDPAVQKILLQLVLHRNRISIASILSAIKDWTPIEQLFYLEFIYLKVRECINPNIEIVPQYHVHSGNHRYRVDFKLSLPDEVKRSLAPITAFVECDSRAFHDRTAEEFTKERQRLRALQRHGAKVYPFSGAEIRANARRSVLECIRDLERELIARREIIDEGLLG